MNTKKRKARSVIAATTLIGSLITGANAAVTITNFQLTESSVSFDFNGTLPNSGTLSPEVIYFSNPNIFASPGFVLGDDLTADTFTFTGTQSLTEVSTSPVINGDFFSLEFSSNLFAEQDISGSLSASWSGIVFNPTGVELIDVGWGVGSGGVGAINISTVAVPEPSSSVLFTLGSLGLMLRRKRN